jgi:phosphohistidine phosphatase
MNRILYLVRHADAENALSGNRDFDRVLSAEGRRSAKIQAERFIQSQGKIDGLISSNAPRAWQTAEIFAEAANIPDNRCIKWPILYSGKVDELIAAAIPRSWNQVVLIGHNPTMSEMAHLLCNSYKGELPTCGVVGIAFSQSQWLWPNAGKIILQLQPS